MSFESQHIAHELDTAAARDREWLPRQTHETTTAVLDPLPPIVSEPESVERAQIVRDIYSLEGEISLLIRRGWDKATPRGKRIKEYLNAELVKAKEELEAFDAKS